MRGKTRNLLVIAIVSASLLTNAVYAAEHEKEAEDAGDESQVITASIKHIISDNEGFVKSHGEEYFAPFAESQHPKVTVVMCSDSRVQTHAIDSTPDNELFVIRNIGNQITTSEGSIEYGVHHLHTPVLLIVGHVRCGAIKAASGDYSKESPAIQNELKTINIPRGVESLLCVKKNVNNQVWYAKKKFETEIKEGKLVVLGAIYDFAGDMKQGCGKLTIINVNGDTSNEATKMCAVTERK